MKNTKEAIQSKHPQIIFECFDYIIEKIPYNYKITIKCALRDKSRGIDRELYTHPEHGLDYAKDVAKNELIRWFRSGRLPEQPKHLKTS